MNLRPRRRASAQIQELLQQSIESVGLIDEHHMRAFRHDDQGGSRQGCPAEVGRLSSRPSRDPRSRPRLGTLTRASE